jgi:hypothetical protein
MIVLSEVPNMPTEPGPISFKAGAGHGDRRYPGLISVVSGQLWPVAMTTWSALAFRHAGADDGDMRTHTAAEARVCKMYSGVKR